MKFLETLETTIASEFELLEFLKGEVEHLGKRNHVLEELCKRAYTLGYAECHEGKEFDKKFNVDDIDGGL